MMESRVSIIDDIIRSYPELAERMRCLKYSASVQGKDPTARAALVKLPREEQRRYRAITAAIQHTTRTYQDGIMRMLVIRSTYWTPSLCWDELGSISASKALEYQHDFIQAVTQRLRLSDCNGCIHWRKLFGSSIDVLSCMYCYDTGCLRICEDGHCYSKSLRPDARIAAVSLDLTEKAT